MSEQDRIKALEREVELLKEIIDLTKAKLELDKSQRSYPVYVPCPVYPSSPAIDPWRPYYPYGTTAGAAVR